MSKALAPFLARASVDQTETQHDAVGRVVQFIFEKHDGTSEADAAALAEGRNALYMMLGSSHLAVVSKACRGLTELLTAHNSAEDISEANNRILKALEATLSRQQDQQPLTVASTNPVGPIAQALTRCLVASWRMEAAKSEKSEENEIEQGKDFGALIASVLSMNRGLMYTPLAHEATCLLGLQREDGQNYTPREAVRVVGLLASVILLQPEYANLRGGFLLKLSTASASTSPAMKLSLVVFQAELLFFCAVHTAAHADVAAGWCDALANASLSLDSDAAWKEASRAVAAATIYLVAEFREHGLSIAQLLPALQCLVEADPHSLTNEVAFLGIAALQSSCIDEREGLLDIVGKTTHVMPRHIASNSGIMDSPSAVGSTASTTLSISQQLEELWSLETLVYPVASMSSTGNTIAAEVLPLLEAALVKASARKPRGGLPMTVPKFQDANYSPHESSRGCSTVLLGVRRLCTLEGNEEELVRSCEGLKRCAGDFGRGYGSPNERAAAISADIESAFCVLAPLLLRPRTGKRVTDVLCAATVAMVRAVPTLGIRLLPFLLYVIRRRGGLVSDGSAVLGLLQLLPELGRHKVAAKPVAGVIQALARAHQPSVRGVGLRLAALLIGINSRTFNQLHALLAETPEQNRPPSSAEPDESRLARVAGMLDICLTDPEQGLDFIRPLQAFLVDPMPAVTALALRAIAVLCRDECLDFDAALRIVSKKGKVAHTGSAVAAAGTGGYKWGDARVMAALAKLCGSGAEAAAAATAAEVEDSDEDRSDAEHEWGMGAAVETLLGLNLRSHPDVSVRVAVYRALENHLPALLLAEVAEETGGDAVALAPRVRAFVAGALAIEPALCARASLNKAAGVILAAESVEPATWVPLKHRSRGADRGDAGDDLARGPAEGRTGPSNRLLAVLPTADDVLQTFRLDVSSSPGLAGAALWSYPSASVIPSAAAEGGAARSMTAQARRDGMVVDLAELLAAEGGGVGGLGVCPWQRASIPLGVQRYVTRLLAACFAAEASSPETNGDVEVAAATIEACRKSIEGLRGVPSSLIALALASLANCVPASFAHVKTELADQAISRLRAQTTSEATSAQSVLSGDEIIPMCAAMTVRTLPESGAEKVMDALQEIQDFAARVSGTFGSRDRIGEVAQATVIPNDALSFWSVAALGVASEWACSCPRSPTARRVLLYSARHLLGGLAREVESDVVGGIAEAWFGEAADMNAAPRVDGVVEWGNVDLGRVSGHGEDIGGIGTPATADGLRCMALFMGLSSVVPGLRSTEMHAELLQVFHIVRAFQEAGVCGAAFCLPTAASECLSCGLVDAPVVLACLRSLSLAMDGATAAIDSSSSRDGDMKKLPPAQDACLGVAGLVVACEGKVTLPAGFAESVFDGLRKAATHRRGGDSGARVAALLALGSTCGCPLLPGGELRPRCMRISSVLTRRMAELLLKDLHRAMDGISLRPKNAAARVWGCLAALGQDERSIGNPTLSDALGWSCGAAAAAGVERGGVGGSCIGGSGSSTAVAGLIRADALRVAREGTLMNSVLTGLQTVAEGGVLSVRESDDALAGGGTNSTDANKPLSSFFAQSALVCLEPCGRAGRALRVPHAQMKNVLMALFRGGHGDRVEVGCISLALALADKDQAYIAWLRDLLRGPIFGNLAGHTRLHLVSLFDRLALKLPPGTVGNVIEEVWDNIKLESFSSSSESCASRLPASSRQAGTGSGTEKGSVDLVAVFLCSLGNVVLIGEEGPGTNLALPATLRESVASVTFSLILPSILTGYAGVDVDDDRVSFLDGYGAERPLWDALLGLLCCLPRRGVIDAVGFKPGAVTGVAAKKSLMLTSVERNEQAIRAYLVARLAAAEQQPAASSEETHSSSSSSSPTSASASGMATRLGYVARWATRTGTGRWASAAVLPHLVEGLKHVSSTLRDNDAASSAAAWRAGWLRTTLDTAGLPETCAVQSFALLGAAAAAWEPPSSLARLVVGEMRGDVSSKEQRLLVDPADGPGEEGGEFLLLARTEGMRYGREQIPPSANGGDGGGGGRWKESMMSPGAQLFALRVAAPKAVMSAERVSAGASTEILARLFRVPGMLRSRNRRARVASSDDVCEVGTPLEFEEVRIGVEGFIKGLRHCPAVLGGRLSGQFATYANSVAGKRVDWVLSRLPDVVPTREAI